MKKVAITILSMLVFAACGETKKSDTKNATGEVSKKETTSDVLPSADYSSLLRNYSCDMDIAEVAKVLDVPETDLNIPDYAKKPAFTKTGNCAFSLKGFGKGAIGDTGITFGTTKMTKADIKNEINSYLKRQEEGLEKITNMYFVLADTKDSYIATQLSYGRVIIFNENYNNAFYISIGTRNANTDRTKEQHEALTQKMVKLANYILKKHRK